MAARGLIIVLPLLIAAGVAVYESPQIRQFLDEHRRKIALALNDFGDQISSATGSDSTSQRPAVGRRANSNDIASTREDQGVAAEERRRQYREEIAARRRVMEQRRGGNARRGSSFDDLVDSDGNLRGQATGNSIGMNVLRRRNNNESSGAALGSTFANPFADEMALDSSEERGITPMSDEELARQLQAHYDEEYALLQRSPAVADAEAPLSEQEVQELERIVREEAGRQGKELPEPGSRLQLSDDELSRNLHDLHTHLSQPEMASVGENTPATSAAPSTRHVVRTPASSNLDASGVVVEAASTQSDEEPLVDFTPTTSAPGTPRLAVRQEAPRESYWSIQDWAEQSSASFHSLYDSSVGQPAPRAHSEVSELESIGEVSEAAGTDADVVSELGISTPGTWTEVGSVISGDGHGAQHH